MSYTRRRRGALSHSTAKSCIGEIHVGASSEEVEVEDSVTQVKSPEPDCRQADLDSRTGLSQNRPAGGRVTVRTSLKWRALDEVAAT